MKTDRSFEIIKLIDKLFFMNDKIHLTISDENITETYRIIENRERLINIIQTLQSKESQAVVSQAGHEEISTKIKILMDEDLVIIENLKRLERKIKIEMGHTFENRSKIEGYNLRNVR